MVAEQWEPEIGDGTEPQTEPISVVWRGETVIWNDLSTADQRDYITWKREIAAEAARNAVLDAIAAHLVASGKRIRAERGQDDPPPQPGRAHRTRGTPSAGLPGSPSDIAGIGRQPKPVKKPKRARKS